jgi:dipeptidase E
MKRMFLAASIDRTGPAIARDIEKVTGKKAGDLKLAFITTAAEGSSSPDKSWLDDDRDGFIKGGFDLFDYTITGKDINQIKSDLGSCDVIHVNGGNSFYLLLQFKKSGFDKWIKDEIEKGRKIYTASSAGTQVVSPNIEVLQLPDSKIYAEQLTNFDGVGLVDFVVFPHWGSEKFKNKYFDHRLKLAYKPENKIILLNNWQYIQVEDDMYKIRETSK